MDLPKRPRSKQKATEASLAVASCFGEEGWIYRDQEDQEDYGVDGEVEVVLGGDVTGWIFKVQVRAREITWHDGAWTMPVKVSHFNLWRELPVPVLVLAYDALTKNIYWTTPNEPTPKPGAGTVSLRFDQHRVLRGQLRELLFLLRAWRAGYGDRHLEEAPLFYRMFRELEDSADGDFFLDIGPELHGQLRLFHRHLLRLRYALGMSVVTIPTLEFWRRLDVALGTQESTLRYGILSMLMDVIRPLYYDGLVALGQRIRESGAYEGDEWAVLQMIESASLGLADAERRSAQARTWVTQKIAECEADRGKAQPP